MAIPDTTDKISSNGGTKKQSEDSSLLSQLNRHDMMSNIFSMIRSLSCCLVSSENRRSKIRYTRFIVLFLVSSYCLLFGIYNFVENYSPTPTIDLITYQMLRHRPRTVYVSRSLRVKSSRPAAQYEPHHRHVEPLSDVKVQTDTSVSPFEEGDCKAMHDWQLNYQPACNSVHEINMMENRYLAEGGFRSVWWMRDSVNGSEAVMKVLSWRKSFREREKERHRRDATAYAMLHGSKHIPNIYGYCKSYILLVEFKFVLCYNLSLVVLFSNVLLIFHTHHDLIKGTNSAIFDVAREGTLEDMLEDPDHEIISKWTPKDKLRYAWQATKALADVHSVGNIYNSAAISHTDVGPSQYLWIDGMFKVSESIERTGCGRFIDCVCLSLLFFAPSHYLLFLVVPVLQLNDFNRARFIRWDNENKEACPFFIPVNGGVHRSPEEYTDDSPLTEKIDVFSLGNILWSIVTGENVYTDLGTSEVKDLVKSGQFVDIPAEARQKLTVFEQAIVKAMDMCLVIDVKKRSTSIEVEKYLHKKLKEYGVSEF